MKKLAMLALFLALLAPPLALADPTISSDISAVNGWFCWGNNLWPHTQHRYAECWTAMYFAESLAHPTYVNAILRESGGDSVRVYIDTAAMVQAVIPGDSQEYLHGAWGNWKAKRSGGHYVGSAALTGGNTLHSWNIDTWSHQNQRSDGYYIMLDVFGGGAVAYQVWLGLGGWQRLGAREEPRENMPHAAAQSHALPNPSRGATTIRYQLVRDEHVSARVYDISGNCVSTMLNSARQEPGVHDLKWDGRNDGGDKLSAGTYFYRIDTSDEIIQGKLILQ